MKIRPIILGLLVAALWAPSALTARSPDPDTAEADTPTTRSAATKPTTSAKPGTPTPQVEVFIPSITKLVDAAKRSDSARIARALSGVLALPTGEGEDDFDFGAVLDLFKQLADWPDTSMALATYTQDREGRPRWALRLDWPLEDLVSRIRTLLERPGTRKILKDVEFRRGEGGEWRIELPDLVLAVLRKTEGGSLIASNAGVSIPTELFGRKKNAASDSDRSQLLYCRLNLDAGDDADRSSGLFGMIVGVSDIRYGATLDEAGQWKERFSIRWNPAIGLMIKSSLKKVGTPFLCPAAALVSGAVSIDSGGLADEISELPTSPIAGREGADMAVVVAIGDGFLPFPSVFYAFNSRASDSILKSIRKALADDAAKRREDDRPPTWREESVDDRPVFWRDPSADDAGGYRPVSYRTVVFFDEAPREGEEPRQRLVIAETPGWADDAVRHWKRLRAGAKEMIPAPAEKKSAWEIVVHWKQVYTLIEPYLTTAASVSEDSVPPAGADELAPALSDSKLSVRIEYAGLDVRHRGPIPFGAIYVPLVTASSLSASGAYGSEAEREQIACRNLRVLHHHAKLFQRDYGRWPSTVAELDGYVDFKSHPHLLSLRDPDRGFAGRLASVFSRGAAKVRSEGGEEIIDDSLYEIDWSPTDWRLKFRPDRFKDYATIYIDAEGEIHRVPKPPGDIRAGGKSKKDAA